MASFSYDDDALLIEQVHKNPPLYDTALIDYKDGALKDYIWSQISTVMDKSSSDCRKRWKNLRDSYNRCKRKNKTRTGSSTSQTTNWCFFEALRFLDESSAENSESHIVIKIRTEESNDDENNDDETHADENNADETKADENNANETDTDESNAEYSETEGGSDFDVCADDEDSKEGKRYRNQTDIEDAVEASRIVKKCKSEPEDECPNLPDKDEEDTNRVVVNTTQCYDDIDSYCLYVRDILRKLTPTLRVKAKIEMFNLLSQCEVTNLELNKG